MLGWRGGVGAPCNQLRRATIVETVARGMGVGRVALIWGDSLLATHTHQRPFASEVPHQRPDWRAAHLRCGGNSTDRGGGVHIIIIISSSSSSSSSSDGGRVLLLRLHILHAPPPPLPWPLLLPRTSLLPRPARTHKEQGRAVGDVPLAASVRWYMPLALRSSGESSVTCGNSTERGRDERTCVSAHARRLFTDTKRRGRLLPRSGRRQATLQIYDDENDRRRYRSTMTRSCAMNKTTHAR